MTERYEEPISAEQAATLIYQTRSPNPAQVGGVRDLMRRGDLRQSGKRQFTTTRKAVAEFLTNRELKKADRAAREAEKGLAGSVAADASRPRPRDRRVGKEENDWHLRRIYREFLNDYFLSVVIYGRSRNRSAHYQRNVLIARSVLLLALVVFISWTVHSMLNPAAPPEEPWMAAGRVRVQQHQSAERQTVEAWLRLYRKSAELLDILPAHPRPAGKALRVRYRHQITDKRTKETRTQMEDAVFIMKRKEVLLMEFPGPEDVALEAQLAKPAS